MKIIRGLSMRHPWCWAMQKLGKRIENRTWCLFPEMRGQFVALHGSKAPVGESVSDYWEDCEYGFEDELEEHYGSLIGEPGIDPTLDKAWIAKTITPFAGKIFAVARIIEVQKIPEGQDRWAVSNQHWFYLEDYTALSTPMPCRGAQKFWELPPEVLAQVRAQYATARGAV
jgi:hypothetical protein